MIVYLDPASIHNEMLRRFPNMSPDKSRCYLPTDNSPCIMALDDWTDCKEGIDIEIGPPTYIDYFGLHVRLTKWHDKPQTH